MKKKSKIHYTNEELSKKFKSNFDLVNYAIKLAENMIGTGRDARVKSEVQNRAMLILEEIQEGKDQFDEIKTAPSTFTNASSPTSGEIIYEERMEKRKQSAAEKL